tara:strand:+ start:472 stop:648 length:177 start_codon:yes stop_codon:yes gene_type:complete
MTTGAIDTIFRIGEKRDRSLEIGIHHRIMTILQLMGGSDEQLAEQTSLFLRGGVSRLG